MPAEIQRTLGRLLAAALALLTVTTPAIIVVRSLDMSGAAPGQALTVTRLVLEGTDFGHVWGARVAALPLLWLVLSRSGANRRSLAATWALLLLLATIAWTRGATGHAGDHGDYRASVWIDAVHLFGAGLWGGVIIAFLVAVRGALAREANRVDVRAAIVGRLSLLAGLGLVLAISTGLYNGWRELGGWAPLWCSRYGHILDVKLGLVIAMACLGASNRFLHVPRLTSSNGKGGAARGLRRMAVTAAAEAVLLLAILAVVAVLLHAEPPVALPRPHGSTD